MAKKISFLRTAGWFVVGVVSDVIAHDMVNRPVYQRWRDSLPAEANRRLADGDHRAVTEEQTRVLQAANRDIDNKHKVISIVGGLAIAALLYKDSPNVAVGIGSGVVVGGLLPKRT